MDGVKSVRDHNAENPKIEIFVFVSNNTQPSLNHLVSPQAHLRAIHYSPARQDEAKILGCNCADTLALRDCGVFNSQCPLDQDIIIVLIIIGAQALWCGKLQQTILDDSSRGR